MPKAATQISGKTQSARDFLRREAEPIRAEWLKILRREWGRGKSGKWAQFQLALDEKADTFSIVQNRHASRKNAKTAAQFGAAIERVQSETFLISDLHFEVDALKQAISKRRRADDAADVILEIHRDLDEFFSQLLKETSNVYEMVSELGERALCIFDGKWTITYANRKARSLLAANDLVGRRVLNIFDSLSRPEMKKLLELQPSSQSVTRRLSLKVNGKRLLDTVVEVSPLSHPTERSVGYIAISEQFSSQLPTNDAFNEFDQGVIRVDLDNLDIVFANPVAAKIIGQKKYKRLNILDLVREPSERTKVWRNQKQRRQGKLGKLKLNIVRADNGRRVPVRVTSLPEHDHSRSISTAVVFLEDLSIERIGQRLDEVISRAGNNYLRILTETAKELQEIFCRDVRKGDSAPQEQIIFGGLKDDGKYGKVELVWDVVRGKRLPDWKVRWYENPPARLKWFKSKSIHNEHLETFLRRKGNKALRSDDEIAGLLDAGFKRFMSRIIKRDGKIFGSVSLISTDAHAYSAEDEALLEAFPLEKAINAALTRKSVSDYERLSGMFQKLIASPDMKSLAENLTEGIAKQNKWSNVSVFRINDDAQGNQERRVELLCQREGRKSPNGYRLRKVPGQALRLGLIGRAARAKKVVHTPDWKNDEQYANDYVKANGKTVSELVVPIMLEDRAFWILNIEDCDKNAFSEPEIQQVQQLAQLTEKLLDGVAARYISDMAFDISSDAVIVTDRNGDIRRKNPSAEALLGYPVGKSEDAGFPTHLSELFVNKKLVREFLSDDSRPGRRVKMYRSPKSETEERRTVEMLLSTFKLPKEIQDCYLIGQSLEPHKRWERNEDLRGVIGQIAVQMRTPLSLLQSSLYRVVRRVGDIPDPVLQSLVARCERQSLRIRLILDRLAHYDEEETTGSEVKTLIDIGEMIDEISASIAGDSSNLIQSHIDNAPAEVVGDPYQLNFVFESILGYLLPKLPVDESIQVSGNRGRDALRLLISAPIGQHSVDGIDASSDQETNSERDTLIGEMLLGQRTIKKFIENQGGSFSAESPRMGFKKFSITLPIAEV